MRIGLAQINTTVGDIAGNRAIILGAYRALVAQGAQLVVFPELAVTGCPPRDLIHKRSFVRDNEDSITEIAAQTGPVPALVGFVETNPSPEGRRHFNAAAFCHNGEIRAIARKTRLPSHDVFDDERYFEPAPVPCVVDHNGLRIVVTIGGIGGETDGNDGWRQVATDGDVRGGMAGTLATLAARNPALAVNLASSPWHCGVERNREQHAAAAARALRCPLVHVNAIGGNDELIHDGQSLVADARGRIIARCAAFAGDLRIIDTTADKPDPSDQPDLSDPSADFARIHAALVLGLRDYARKTGFKRAHIALSGGLDSALVAVLAVDALGRENITGVALPSVISSQHSLADARALARNLGIRIETISIADCVAACETALAPHFAGRPRDTAEENIQSRARGLLMMALSNKFDSLLLTTGNKSELAVGYCTLYGDMNGGLAVIADLYKTQVRALARWINRDREIIPQNTIDKVPSAELRPNQTDQDTLPPYDILDPLIRACVEENQSRRELIARGFAPATVADITRKIDLAEYKRRQAAPGLRITPRAFGPGRRIPIVHKYAG